MLNVTAGNDTGDHYSIGVMTAGNVHVDGTLNVSYGFSAGEGQYLSCGVLYMGELTGSGTVNAVMLQLDQTTMELKLTVRGEAVLASNWKAMTDVETIVATIFTVAEGAVLTIPEGVTLDLTGLPGENISILGTVIKNGTILCNHNAQEDNGDCTTDILCSICGQVVIPGNAEHAWNDATCTEPKTCSVCKATEGEALGHNHENGVCTICGHAQVKLETAALSFKEMIHYNIFFTLGVDEDVALSDMGLILFDSLKADGTMDDAIATYSGAVEMNGMYMVATDGVHAKRMGDTIYFRAYAKLADGSYVYSKTVQYSTVTYAEHILNSDKALVAAMLNYGAQAQLYFGYNTENLANASLTEEQKALVKGYESDLLAPVAKPDDSKAGTFASTGTGFARKAPAVSFEGSFVLNYFFTPSEAVAGDMTLYYWTEADYAAATELTAENATGSILMQSGEQYHAKLDGIFAKDVDDTVYVAAIYSDGTATHCTGVLSYSIGAYLTSHAAKETGFRAMAQAAAVYCSYCREYFEG